MIATMQVWLEAIAGQLWGWPMLILLVGSGVWLTLTLKGLQFRMLFPSLWEVVRPLSALEKQGNAAAGMISNRAALWTALAATVGTGNIAGVATAIALGGPGAMFWMWVSGLFGMAIKYAETTLGVYYRVKSRDAEGRPVFRGGPMYYLRDGVRGPTGRMLGMMFAGFLAFAAFSIGGMVQSNSVADALNSNYGFNPTLVGVVMTGLAAIVMFGGLQWIARVSEWLVPSMIALYAVSGTLILLLNAPVVPELFASIFQDAFTGTAATGGFAGSALLLTMRYGLARGVFANESGLGSAPIVAATARTRHPVEQGLLGMTQTFIDTFFVCTFTGLVILVTGAWLATGVQSGGAALTSMAFDGGLGNLAVWGMPVGGSIVSMCLILFAFTTVLGWGFYGQQGAVYLFGSKVAKPYIILFLLFTLFGAVVLDLAETVGEGVTFIWTIADIATGLMMLPNLLALWLLGPVLRRLTADYMRNRYEGRPLAEPAFYETVASGGVKTPAKVHKARKPAGKTLRRR